MWSGDSSALAASVSAADPFNFPRNGDIRDGLRLATVSILYRRQRHRLVAHAVACQEDKLTVDKHRSKGNVFIMAKSLEKK